MKVNGVEATKSFTVPLVLPRGEKPPLVFYAEPLPNLDEFEKLCPIPTAGQTYTPKGIVLNTQAPEFVAAMQQYQKKRWAYTIIRSLAPSKIEWEKVNPHNHETWLLVEDELRQAVSHFEYGLIVGIVEEANALDPAKLKAARDDFFRTEAAKESP